MIESNELDKLLKGVNENNRHAAEDIVRNNYERIVRIVRGRIGGKYKAKIDEESVALSAMRSFIDKLKSPNLEIEDHQDLWNLLNCIALRKLSNRIRHFNTASRSVDREVHLDDVGDVDLRSAADGPEAEGIINDLLDVLMQGYSDLERRVLEMSLMGHSVNEIAGDVSYSERNVIRIRTHFRKRLEAENRLDAM